MSLLRLIMRWLKGAVRKHSDVVQEGTAEGENLPEQNGVNQIIPELTAEPYRDEPPQQAAQNAPRATLHDLPHLWETHPQVRIRHCEIFNDFACVNGEKCNDFINKHLSSPEYVHLRPFYLGIYYPKRSSSHYSCRYSQKILLFKKGGPVVKEFCELICQYLSTKSLFIVCPYPASSVGYAGRPLQNLVKAICAKLPNCQDGTEVIFRKIPVSKKSTGGLRNYELEISSLEIVNADRVVNQQVLLIDDVTTTGTSLRAGASLLLDKGAAVVVKLALGQTEGGNTPEMQIYRCHEQ